MKLLKQVKTLVVENILLVLVLVALASALLIAVNNSQNRLAQAQELITVNVANVLQTQTTGGARLGINTNYWWDEQANRTAGARTLPTALSDMGTKYWRYPGGEKADGYLWSLPPFTSSNPRLARISSQDWPANDTKYWTPAGSTTGAWSHAIYNFDKFMAECLAANCTPVMVVAYDGIYKTANSGGVSLTRQQALDTATAWVNYANRVKGYNIKYWEVGNETWNSGYMGGDPGRAQQAQDVAQFCQAMKSVDATILCGVNANSQADWNTILAGAASSLDFLSVHAYPAYGYGSFSTYQQNVLSPKNKVDEAWNALQNYPDRTRIKLAVTETGGMTYGSWNQADLGHALMTFDILAQLQQDSRVAFTQFWNTRFAKQNAGGNVWPYAESEYDALKPDNAFSPQGMAVNILADYSLANMVGTTSTTNVRTFASHDPATGKLTMWLINKSSSSQATTITLQNYTGSATGTVFALKGTGSTDMYPTFSQVGTTSVVNNQINVTLTPVSLTVIQLGGSSTSPTATSLPAQPTPTPTLVAAALPTATPRPTNTPVPSPTSISTANLALGKVTTTSSVYGSSYVGSYAVDGNAKTRWWTFKGSTLPSEWITVNLGNNYSIKKVVLNQGDRWATAFSVKVSLDGVNWTTVWGTTSGVKGINTVVFSPVTARYVRFESTAWYLSSDRVKLHEFEVY